MLTSILDEPTAGNIEDRLQEALSLAEQSGDTLVVALISDAMDHVGYRIAVSAPTI
jgi:hypothetical protein